VRALALLALLARLEGPAEASPSVQRPRRLQLQWRAPPACPGPEEVWARVRQRVPDVDEPLAPGQVPLDLRASLEPVPGGFELELRLTQGPDFHARELSALDCSLLTDAAALVIAVALDPVATAASVPWTAPAAAPELELDPLPERAPEIPAPLDPPDALPRPPDDDEANARTVEGPGDRAPRSLTLAGPRPRPGSTVDLRVGLRALAGGGYGPMNTAYATIGGGVALLGDRFRVALDGRWVARRTIARPSGAGGQIDAWLLGAQGCFVPSARRIELPVCAGVEAGRLRGRGLSTLPVVEEAAIPHAALRLGPGLAWAPTERLALGFDLELAVPVTRGEFVIDQIVIQRVAPVNVRGVLGVELRLP